MRDRRFITEHRGGLLKKERHRQLIRWAYSCVEHVLPFYNEKLDNRLMNAIFVAKEWEKENATVGDARKASVEVHALTRELLGPTLIAIARAAGHAVATAHMADHSLGAALYSLKAIKSTGELVDKERKWQNKQLPSEIKGFVLDAMRKKEEHFKIYKN